MQVAILFKLLGPDSLAIHKTFTFAEGDNVNDYELVLRKFTDYCRPRKNIVYERYRFWKRDQEEGEKIDQWLVEFRMQAAMCEFGPQEELVI